MHAFLHRLGPQDRVLLVGDVASTRPSMPAGRTSSSRMPAWTPCISTTIVRQEIRR